MDGVFDDWGAAAPLAADPSGDGSSFDFGRIWAADDARFLYLRIEVGPVSSFDENNALVLYLDTDANAATGLAIGGLGAELEWKLGVRNGVYRRGASTATVYHDDIRFRAFPTVTATEFELCFGRDTLPNGTQPLFFGPTVRFFLRDTAAGGDQIPNAPQVLSYTMDQGAAPTTTALGFAREEATDLRVATHNVLGDGLWGGAEQPRFRRLYQAAAPDIFALQEIYDHTPAQTQALIQTWLPGTWYSADVNDCQTISRYPIEASWAIDNNLASLLDTTVPLGRKLLLVNAHLPCCANEAQRQQEIDRILRFLRDAMHEPGGVLDVPAGTVIAVTGDLNLVGEGKQLTSLITGDVVDESTYGADFAPDWDGTAMTDLISRQTEKRTSYTWRSDASSFWPGRLDFLIYADSVLETGNHFLVFTEEMSAAALTANGLQLNDSDASDHLLQVRDLRPRGAVEAPTPDAGSLEFRVLPNPLVSSARLMLSAPVRGQVELELFDVRGRRVLVETRELLEATSEIALELGSTAERQPGVYWLRVTSSAGAVGAAAKRTAGTVAVTLLPQR